MPQRKKAKQRETCIYCGCRLRKAAHKQLADSPVSDHVEPLSRGGKDSRDNVVMCCHGCNSSKGSRFLLEWVWSGDHLFRLSEYGRVIVRFFRTGRWPKRWSAADIQEVKRRAYSITDSAS